MKRIYLLATALAALVSCTSDDFTGEPNLQESNNGKSISFDLNTATVTRAGGSGAASALDNQFIVWGEKNESGGTAVSVPSANIVFPNYQVNWVNLPNSTTSNTNGWEYVGYTHSNTGDDPGPEDNYQAYITPHLTTPQEIKYWDLNASNYVFTAVSALKNDIKTGKIRISKTLSGTDEYAKGYQITAAADATFANLYIADRIEQTSGYGTAPVTLHFRNILSHIRVGVYETIPGYAVSSIKFYGADFTDGSEFKVSSTPAFGATVDNLKPGAQTLTITYNDGSENASLKNRPIVSTGSSRDETITLGTNFNEISTSSTLAETSAQPTWDSSTGTYTSVFPREGILTDMTMKAKFTLYNEHSGETMVKQGTAVVPGEYLQWKPNFKYTYIFKLTDDDLIPITFDAVQVETETGDIEYITTVDNLAITTYQNGSTVTSSNEYTSGEPIYVVVGDGQELKISEEGSGLLSGLYTAVAQTGYIGGVTEASVANAIAHGVAGWYETTPASGTSLIGYYARSGEDPSYTYTMQTSGTANGSTAYYLPTKTLTDAGSKTLTVTGAAGLVPFTEIPYADSPTGEDLTINGATFTPAAAGYYVFEYTDGSGNKHYKVIKVVE